MKFEIESAHSPVWANSEKTAINLVAKFQHLDMEIDFTADINDGEEHGVAIFEAAMDGGFGQVAEYVEQPVAEARPSRVEELELQVANLSEQMAQIRETLNL